MQCNHDNTISGLDQDTGELLAVKEMGVTADEGNMRTLCREIELMMRLEHENCVAIRGAEVKQDPKEGLKLYALFEWVPGGSLHALLGKFSKFNESVVAIYLRQILCGLAYLHANGIFHRDLKGENVLLDESGRVKLADFGESTLASDEAHRTAAAAVKPGSHKRSGTPYFMAPEIMARNEYTAAADVWSVGGVALELATGQPPWKELNFSRPRDLFEVGAVVGTRRVAWEDRARLFTTRSVSRLSDHGAWRARRRESSLLFTHNTLRGYHRVISLSLSPRDALLFLLFSSSTSARTTSRRPRCRRRSRASSPTCCSTASGASSAAGRRASPGHRAARASDGYERRSSGVQRRRSSDAPRRLEARASACSMCDGGILVVQRRRSFDARRVVARCERLLRHAFLKDVGPMLLQRGHSTADGSPRRGGDGGDGDGESASTASSATSGSELSDDESLSEQGDDEAPADAEAVAMRRARDDAEGGLEVALSPQRR